MGGSVRCLAARRLGLTATCVVLAFAAWSANAALGSAGSGTGAISVTRSGLSVTLQGTWSWPDVSAPCGPGTPGGHAAGWAVQWGDGFTGNRVLAKGSKPPGSYFSVGTATDDAVHLSTANGGLGDCGTAASGPASGTWGPIAHTYAQPGTYTACVVIYDVQYAKGAPGQPPSTTDPKQLVAGSNATPYRPGDHNSDNSGETGGPGNGAQCLPVTFTVQQPTSTTSTPGGDVHLGSGSKLTDSAVLAGGASPGGTITFYLFAPGVTPNATNSNDVYSDTATVSGNGTYSTAAGTNPGGYAPTAAGTYQWLAVYSGDAANGGSQTAFGDEPESALVSHPSLSTTPGGVVQIGSGAKLTDSAALAGGTSPGGTITFHLFAPGVTPNATNSNDLYTDTVAVSGNGTYTTAAGTSPGGHLPTTAGTYQWLAVYSGDVGNTGAGSTFGDEPEAASAAAPALTTVAGADVHLGSGVPLTDTAVLSGGFDPGGTLTFYLFAPGVTPNATNGNNVYSDTVTVAGNGTYTTASGTNPGGHLPTSVGTYEWVVVYGGDGANGAAGSPFGTEPEQALVSHPSLTTTAGGAVVIGSGATLTDRAVLSGGTNPFGTITFYLFAPGATPDATNSNNVYADTVTVAGNGTYTTAAGTNPGGYPPTAAGTYQWVAVYGGDAGNTGTASSFGDEPEAADNPVTHAIDFTKTCFGPVEVGDPYVCTYTVQNTLDGAHDTLTISGLTDMVHAAGGDQTSTAVLDDGFVQATGGATCTSAPGRTCALPFGGKVTIGPFGFYTVRGADYVSQNPLKDDASLAWGDDCDGLAAGPTPGGGNCVSSPPSAPASSQATIERRPSQTASVIHDAGHNAVPVVDAGSLVHDFVSVTTNDPSPSQPTPSGNATVDFFTGDQCQGSPTAESPPLPLLSNGQLDATSFVQGPLLAGFYAFEAHYQGDATYTPSSGSCELLQVVDASIQLTPVTSSTPAGTSQTLTCQVSVNEGFGDEPGSIGSPCFVELISGPGTVSTQSCVPSGVTGSCPVSFSSASTGTSVFNASVDPSVGGLTLHRETGDPHPGDGPNAQVTWTQPPVIYFGYADNAPVPGTPIGLPWAGLSNTLVLGCGVDPDGGGPATDTCPKLPGAGGDEYDAGAIRIDNTTGSPLVVTSAGVTVSSALATCTFAPWPGLNVTVPSGSSLVLTMTGVVPAPTGSDCSGANPWSLLPDSNNFNTADSYFPLDGQQAPAPPGTCIADASIVPVVSLTLDGAPMTIHDTGQVLNTGSIYVPECTPGFPAYQAFVQVFP
jgi:hypothetical protein